MATWEDLDNESESDKDDADEDAKVVVGLVAIVTSEAEPESDSEEENEVYSKIPKEELIESLKEILTHFELISLKDFIMSGINRSRVVSMIYNIYKNNGERIEFSEGKPNETNLKVCCKCIKEGLKTFFVPEGAKFKIVV